MRRATLFLSIAAFAIVAAASEPPDDGLASLLARLQAKYAGTKDYEARFVQVTTLTTMGKREESSGVVQFKTPSMMRWEYAVPEKKLLVCDGKTIWLYTPLDKQAVRQRYSEGFLARTPIALLTGKAALTKEFAVTLVSRDAKTGDVVLLLRPREAASGMSDVRLTVDEKTLDVRATEFVDAYGNRTVVRFSGAKVNAGIAAGRFTFVPPPGTEIVSAP
jgi:outer membrane lipoprotein carrier protein